MLTVGVWFLEFRFFFKRVMVDTVTYMIHMKVLCLYSSFNYIFTFKLCQIFPITRKRHVSIGENR